MSRKFSSITVIHVARQHPSKRRSSKAKLTRQSSLTSTHLSNVSVHRPVLPSNTTKTIIERKQKKNHQQAQHRQISSLRTDKEEHPTNPSPSDFDKFSARLTFSRGHRITPVNTHELFNDDFQFDVNDR